MDHENHRDPLFPPLPLDAVVARQPAAYRAVGLIGEGFLAGLLKGELSILQQAHREGADSFLKALTEHTARAIAGRPGLAAGPMPGDLAATIRRACAVLAYGQEHRLFGNLRAQTRFRLGWHVLRRGDAARDAIDRDPAFGDRLERSLAAIQEAAGQEIGALLAECAQEDPGAPGVASCSLCGRRWRGEMPQMQILPTTYEILSDWDPASSSRDAIMELSGAFYRLELDGETPLLNVCCHDHVVRILVDGSSAFDPWSNQLAVGLLPPEHDHPLFRAFTID